MSETRFQWKRMDSGGAKESRWNTAANGAVPREAWYYGPRLGRTELTPAFEEALRRTFWPGVELKIDESLAISGVPLLRVTLPGKFVPHFDADDTTFYLYKAASALTVVDFGQLWGGPRAEAKRRASPMTMMGDVGLTVDPRDMPAPRGVLRAEQSRAEEMRQDPVTTEVDPLPDRSSLKIIERVRPTSGRLDARDLPAEPVSGQTLIPPVDADDPVVSSADPSWEAFGGNDPSEPVAPARPKPDDPPSPPVVPPVDYAHAAVMAVLVAIAILFFCGAYRLALAIPL